MTSTLTVGVLAEGGSTVLLAVMCPICDRRIERSAVRSAVAHRGLLGLSVQLLEASHSEEAGQRLVCGQTLLAQAGI